MTDVENKNVASKQDLEVTKLELKQDIKELDLKIEDVKKEIELIKREIKSSEHAVIFKLTGIFAALLAIFEYLPEFLK